MVSSNALVQLLLVQFKQVRVQKVEAAVEVAPDEPEHIAHVALMVDVLRGRAGVAVINGRHYAPPKSSQQAIQHTTIAHSSRKPSTAASVNDKGPVFLGSKSSMVRCL